MVPFEALQSARVQITQAKAPIAMVIRQADQPIGHFVICSIELALLAVTGSGHLEKYRPGIIPKIYPVDDARWGIDCHPYSGVRTVYKGNIGWIGN